MVKIEVIFNPHKPVPNRYNSRRVAIDAAMVADFVPTAQEAIDAIRASKDTKHLRFQKPQRITVQVCDKMSRLASKMYLEIISDCSGEKKPVALLTIRPAKIWILCAIHRGIKLGIL